MAKAICVRKWKDKIMSELSQDQSIIEALGLNPCESEEDLAWVRLFPHYYIPNVQEDVKSYISFEIDIPERRVRYGDTPSQIWTHPIIVFRVIVHQKDMALDLIGESGTRMDYLSELIEDKYEGRLDFGMGSLNLKSYTAGTINETYKVRQLVFEAVEANGICG
jgi:hypothetical protein